MITYIQRMITEREELTDKINKLEDFISSSSIYLELPEIKRNLLKQQLEAMIGYEEVLTERISLEN